MIAPMTDQLSSLVCLGMDYQGGGGFGGGFDTTANNNNNNSQSPSSNKPRRSYDEQSIQAVTISMALAARPDASGRLVFENNRPLHHVKIVGAIRSVEDHSTNALYQIEDGTGLIDVKQWADQQNDSAAAMELRERTKQENIYVKVVGQIKDYDGKKMIVAESVRPLATGNELAHHMIEVVYEATRAGTANATQQLSYGMPMSGVGFSAGGGGLGLPSSMAARSAMTGNNPAADAVLHFFRINSERSEVGTTIYSCVSSLAGKYSESQIREAINELSMEGVLYSTVDEESFKVNH
jgi:replication factor A2